MVVQKVSMAGRKVASSAEKTALWMVPGKVGMMVSMSAALSVAW